MGSFLFLVPPVLSVVFFLVLWFTDELQHPYIVGSVVLAGALGQGLAPSNSAAWVAAVLVNVGIAGYLGIRFRIGW